MISVVEKIAEKLLRDLAGIKPDYVTTMTFISECIMSRDSDHRRKKRRQRTV